MDIDKLVEDVRVPFHREVGENLCPGCLAAAGRGLYSGTTPPEQAGDVGVRLNVWSLTAPLIVRPLVVVAHVLTVAGAVLLLWAAWLIGHDDGCPE